MQKRVDLTFLTPQGGMLDAWIVDQGGDAVNAVTGLAEQLRIVARYLDKLYAFLVTTPFTKLYASDEHIYVELDEEHVPKLLKYMGGYASVKD